MSPLNSITIIIISGASTWKICSECVFCHQLKSWRKKFKFKRTNRIDRVSSLCKKCRCDVKEVKSMTTFYFIKKWQLWIGHSSAYDIACNGCTWWQKITSVGHLFTLNPSATEVRFYRISLVRWCYSGNIQIWYNDWHLYRPQTVQMTDDLGDWFLGRNHLVPFSKISGRENPFHLMMITAMHRNICSLG